MSYTIFCEISLCLPENYELVAGTIFDNIHLYYELIRATIVGTAHSIILILEITLKTESTLYSVQDNRLTYTGTKWHIRGIPAWLWLFLAYHIERILLIDSDRRAKMQRRKHCHLPDRALFDYSRLHVSQSYTFRPQIKSDPAGGAWVPL